MKTHYHTALLGLLTVSVLFAAPPQVSQDVSHITEIRANPANAQASATYSRRLTLEDGTVLSPPARIITWSLAGDEQVDIALPDGKTVKVTRAAVFAAVVAIANAEVVAKGGSPAAPAPYNPNSSRRGPQSRP